MEAAYTEIWEPVLHEENRTKITVLINLEAPSVGQDSCLTIQKYLSHKIEFHSLVIGDSLLKGLICSYEVTDRLVSTLPQAVHIIEIPGSIATNGTHRASNSSVLDVYGDKILFKFSTSHCPDSAFVLICCVVFSSYFYMFIEVDKSTDSVGQAACK